MNHNRAFLPPTINNSFGKCLVLNPFNVGLTYQLEVGLVVTPLISGWTITPQEPIYLRPFKRGLPMSGPYDALQNSSKWLVTPMGNAMKIGHLEGLPQPHANIWGDLRKKPMVPNHLYIQDYTSHGRNPSSKALQPPEIFFFRHLDAHHHIANVKLLMHRPRNSELAPDPTRISAGDFFFRGSSPGLLVRIYSPYTIHVMYSILIPTFRSIFIMVNVGVRFFRKLAGFFSPKKDRNPKGERLTSSNHQVSGANCSSFQGVFTANTSHLAMIGSKSLAKTS